jgi:hypothetical protein
MDPITKAALFDELQKIAAGPVAEYVEKMAPRGIVSRASGMLHRLTDPVEVGGLGVLAAPSVDNMIAKHRARKAGLVDEMGRPTEEGVESKRLIKEKWHDPIEAGGLGLLALPSIGSMVHRRSILEPH